MLRGSKPAPWRVMAWCIVGVGISSAGNAQPLLRKGDSLLGSNAYASAEQAYTSALKQAFAIKDSATAGTICIRLGMVFENQSIFSKALEHCFKGLAIFQAIHAKERIAAANNNIGELYRKLGDFNQGVVFLNRAYVQFAELQDSARIPYVLNNTGVLYLDQGNTAKAYNYFQRILAWQATHVDKDVAYSAMSNIALVLLKKKEYDSSLHYFRRCLTLTREGGDEFRTAVILTNMSELYLELGDHDRALSFQREGLGLATKTGRLKLIKWAHGNLSKIYKAKGDYAKAYASVLKSMELQDSIYSEIKDQYRFAEENYLRRQKDIENINLRQESDLKELKIMATQKSLEYKDRLLVISLVALLLILVIVFLFIKAYLARQANARMLQKQRTIMLENQLKDWELTALRAQMNPHFIFNALSSIKSYMLERDIGLADYYLSKFAKLIRLILDNSSHNLVALDKELQLLESYIQLEQLRFEDKFSYSFHIDPAVNTLETYIPSMLIQPFVENAIIHGFRDKQEKCSLQINISLYHSSVMIVVEDNGTGRLHAKAKPRNTFHESKGYKMTEQRLKALSNNHALGSIVYRDLADGEGNTGTRVEICIPLQEYASTA